MTLGWVLILGATVIGAYTYIGYPLILRLIPAPRHTRGLDRYEHDDEWPHVAICVPAHNEEHQIADTIESLLALEYPAERRQIIVVSDASTDTTDEIVRGYADRGVLLIRHQQRQGKTEAENLAAPLIQGDVVVNTDASIRILPGSLKPLVAPFKDPRVGLTSGRDLSVESDATLEANRGEARYVGYEMWVRDLETAAGGIVGASGCLYATRPELQRLTIPGHLSRDFAAALNTLEHGLVPLSVPDAICRVPRTASLSGEYRRKVRTITRGMETLWHKRALLDPRVHGRFAWMLWSHKVCRWVLPWLAIVGLAGLTLLAPSYVWALTALIFVASMIAIGVLAWATADRAQLPRFLYLPAFVVMGNVAAMKALLRALRGSGHAIWEPTRRRGTNP